MPFRHGIETISYKDNTTILEELGMLNESFGLLKLKTPQKYTIHTHTILQVICLSKLKNMEDY